MALPTGSRATAGPVAGGAHLVVALGELVLRRPSADRRERTLDSVLAGRQAFQGVVLLARPTPATLAASAGVELAHMSSMLVLAALDRRRRRFGLREAALSSLVVAAEAWLWWRAVSRA